MGGSTSVYIKFGAVFTKKEIKDAPGLKAWRENGYWTHPHVEMGSVDDLSYLYVRASGSTLYSRYDVDGDCAEPLVNFLKGDTTQHRKNFVLSCEELGLPFREPQWMVVRSYS